MFIIASPSLSNAYYVLDISTFPPTETKLVFHQDWEIVSISKNIRNRKTTFMLWTLIPD